MLLERGNRRAHHLLASLAVRIENDVGHRLPAAADVSGIVQLLNARRLAIDVILPRLGELRFLGRELLDDVVDLRRRWIRRISGDKKSGGSKNHQPNIRITNLSLSSFLYGFPSSCLAIVTRCMLLVPS